MGVSDLRAAEIGRLHRAAQQADELAEQHRARRNRLIRELREEDPKRWTYARLASLIDSSPELIPYILRNI